MSSRRNPRRVVALGTLTAYLLGLGTLSIAQQLGFGDRTGPTLRLRHLFVPVELLAELLRNAALQLAAYALLGGLATWALDRPGATSGQRIKRRGLAVLLGLGAALLLRRPAITPAAAFTLILPLVGLLVGEWVAAGCLQGRRAVLLRGLKLLGMAVLLSLGGAAMLYLATEDQPLAFEPAKLTPTEKRQLADRIARAETTEGNQTRLCLTQRDLDQLVAVAAEHFPVPAKGRLELGTGTVAVAGTLATHLGPPWGRYLNVQAVCGLSAQSGRVRVEPLACQVGRLHIPPILLRPLGWLALEAFRADPKAAEMLASIEQMRISSEQVELEYRTTGLRDDLVGALRSRLGEPADVVQATAAYYRHLVAAADELPRGDPGFVTALGTAFRLARQRSQTRDPVAENRAAILALAMLLGHPRIEKAVGPVSDRRLRQAGRVYLERATLRGRRDWMRHFFLSAGLTVLTNSAVSDGAGLLKEEIDAGEGGSGFSFADLLADRAGTEFARAATLHPQAARRMQERLSGRFSLDDVFPPTAGLPENIPEAQLLKDYGGVGGPKYRRYLGQIEQRLAGCPVLNFASDY